MSVISHRMQLVYFDMPKVGSTSLKKTLRLIEGDRRPSQWLHLQQRIARRLQRGLPRHQSLEMDMMDIHHACKYRTVSFRVAPPVPEGYETFAIVRDPILRLHSAWRDKVHARQIDQRGETQDVLNEGLSLDPSFGEFIDNFDAYRFVARPARVHTYGCAFHLGPNMQWLGHVFRIEEMSALANFLSARRGRRVKILRENVGPTAARDDRLTPAQRDRLVDITAEDYTWLNGLYRPGAALDRLEAEDGT